MIDASGSSAVIEPMDNNWTNDNAEAERPGSAVTEGGSTEVIIDHFTTATPVEITPREDTAPAADSVAEPNASGIDSEGGGGGREEEEEEEEDDDDDDDDDEKEKEKEMEKEMEQT